MAVRIWSGATGRGRANRHLRCARLAVRRPRMRAGRPFFPAEPVSDPASEHESIDRSLICGQKHVCGAQPVRIAGLRRNAGTVVQHRFEKLAHVGLGAWPRGLVGHTYQTLRVTKLQCAKRIFPDQCRRTPFPRWRRGAWPLVWPPCHAHCAMSVNALFSSLEPRACWGVRCYRPYQTRG